MLKFADGKGFNKQFYKFLVKCDGVARKHSWNTISTPDIPSTLVLTLSKCLIDRWNRTAYSFRKNHECDPSLSDLTDFVDRETTLVNYQIFSTDALECYSGKLENHCNRKYREMKSIAKDWQLPFCSAGHNMEESNKLKGLPVNKNGCCQLISHGHNSKTPTKHATIWHCLLVKRHDKLVILLNYF